MPGFKFTGLAATVSVAVAVATAVPLAGATVSHPPPDFVDAEAVKSNAPLPRFETMICAFAGVDRGRNENDNQLGSTPNRGGFGAVTVNVTATVCVEGLALGAVIVTVPRYVPGARPPAVAKTLRLPGAEPEAGDTAIQPPPLWVEVVALHSKPVMGLETVIC